MRLVLRLHLNGCADFILPELWCEIGSVQECVLMLNA